MGNSFCGECQNININKNKLRSNEVESAKSENKKNQPIQVLQISSTFFSSIKNEGNEHRRQNLHNNKELSTGLAVIEGGEMQSELQNGLPINSNIEPNYQQKTTKIVADNNIYEQRYSSKITVPYSVIKLLLKKQILQQINVLLPNLQFSQTQSTDNLGLTSWKLQRQGFYVNQLRTGEFMIVTQNQFYYGWTKNSTFIPQNKGLLIIKLGYYDGNFVQGRAQGRGKFICHNQNTKFIGNWEKGQLTKGKIQNQFFIYDGTLKNCKPQGQGTLICQNPKLKQSFKYQGSFYEGRFHGEGKYECSAYSYIGNFKNGKKSGFGTLTSQSLVHRTESVPTKIILKGLWQQDRFKQQNNKK